ncbi:MAG: hypothetical protein HY905_19485 [Deltaproteobacteria bacterium]|nr:hypothetical protein [Deltaproteobacteria bacterium]
MKLSAATLVLALAAGGACSGDPGSDAGADTPADPASALRAFGEPCDDPAECTSGLCFEATCTRACARREECPEEGSACGHGPDDSTICRTTRFADGEGRYGDYCSDAPCDEAAGFRCQRRSDDDPYAFCTADCTDDRDCPYDMSCRDGNDGRICRPRAYCEPCDLDDQCGFANDDCIADDAGDRFCSQTCDPARPTTCPTDSLCLEIPAGSGRFQCKPSFGSCVGDGGFCQPCRGDADCNDGALCLTDRYTKFSFCGEPCASSDECASPEFYCTSDTLQCRPKKGSCLHPSGGGHVCDHCADFTDCFDGFCLDTNGDGRGDGCADLCDPSDPSACGPWGTCYRLTDSSGATAGYACLPHETIQCWQYAECVETCPDGPTGCSLPYCR